MSTILDALRKVAEEQRTHGVDVRTRLLSFPSPLSRTRRRSTTVSLISAGVAMTGFAAGAALMYWQARSPGEEERAAPAPLAHAASEAAPVPVLSSLPAAPVLPLPLTGAQDRVSSAPAPTAPPRAVRQPGVPVISKEERRAGVPPQPKPLRQPPPIPAVGAPPAVGNPLLLPAAPFLPTPPEVPEMAGILEPPLAGTASALEDGFNAPAPDAGIPRQLPPVTEESNAGQPNVSLSLLQWSPEADKRIAFLRVNGGPLTMAQEGDTLAGMTVAEIGPEGVTLRSGGKTWVLQAR